MRKKWKILAIAGVAAAVVAAAVIVALSGRKAAVREKEIPLALFRSVPSNAIYVASFENASRGLEILLDSTSVFRRVNLGELRNARMIFSYNYAAQLIPLLGLDLGEFSSEGVSGNAAGLGLKSLELTAGGRRVLLLSPSASLLAQARSHVDSGTSILDAPLFDRVISQRSANTVIVRNSEASRLLPKTFPMMEYVSRRDICSFLKQFSEWMVFDVGPGGKFSMKPVSDGSAVYYHKTLEYGGETRLSDILPYGVEYVADFCFDDWKVRRALIDSYLDAHNKLTRRRAAEKTAGSLDVKEVSRIVFDGNELLLVRPGTVPSKIPNWNPDVLFGSVFDVSDKRCSVLYRDWIVYGRQIAVDEFVVSLKQAPEGWPEGRVSAIIYSKNTGLITARRDNIECVWKPNL